MNRGNEPSDDAGSDGDAQRERQHRRIQVHFVQSRNRFRSKRDQRVEAPRRKQHAENAAGEREQQSLGEQLPQDAPAPAAERSADGELALACRAACEQHAGDVRASDEEHQYDRAEQRLQRRPHRTDQIVEQRDGALRPPRVVGQPRRDPRSYHRQIGLRVSERHSGLQPRERAQRMQAAVLQVLVVPFERDQGFRVAQQGKMEAGRQDADNRVRPAVQRRRLSENARVAGELASPQAIGQDHFVRRARVIRFRGETPPQHRVHFEGREEAARDLRRRELLWT